MRSVNVPSNLVELVVEINATVAMGGEKHTQIRTLCAAEEVRDSVLGMRAMGSGGERVYKGSGGIWVTASCRVISWEVKLRVLVAPSSGSLCSRVLVFHYKQAAAVAAGSELNGV